MMLTLFERGERIVGLDVWLALVPADTNGNKVLERLFELGIELDSLSHGIVVDLVGEDDGTSRVECTVSSGGNQVLVVGVDLSGGGRRAANLPIIAVVLPQDTSQTEGVGDVSNTIVDITVRGTPAGGCDANSEFDHFELEKTCK